MTSDQLINDYTLLPFYSYFVDERTLNDCVRSMKTGNPTTIHARLGISNRVGRVKTPQYLRFCKFCVQDDMGRSGETYWRRQHQLPGVIICTEHLAVLSQSTALMRPWDPIFRDATESALADQSHQPCKLNTAELELAKTVAVRCVDILNKRNVIWPAKEGHIAYRDAAINRGFRLGPALVNTNKLIDALTEFYGDKLLVEFGCAVDTLYEWVQRFFQKHTYKFHPLQHVLIQIFLDSLPTRSDVIAKIGSGPWKCPCPVGSHRELFPIKIIVIHPNKGDAQFASAKCGCGFAFNFECTSPTDASLPIIKRISNFGRQYWAAVYKMKKDGLRNKEIAKRLGISEQAASKLAQRRDISRERNARILLWRKQWTRDRNEAAYQKLRKHDRQWLRTRRPKPKNETQITEKRKRTAAVRWAARDPIWADKISIAAAKIRDMAPMRRVTKTGIMLVSGLRSLNRDIEQGRLPQCAKVMKSQVETLEQWKVRQQAEVSIGDLGDVARAPDRARQRVENLLLVVGG